MNISVPNLSDLSARARILHVAMDVFGEKGFRAATLREIARGARSSPALIAHHFGGKDGLRNALDDRVVAAVRLAADGVELDGRSQDEMVMAVVGAIAGALAGDHSVRAYIRRSFDPAKGRAHDLPGALLVVLDDALQRLQEAGAMRAVANRRALALHVLLQVFGGIVFEDIVGATFPEMSVQQALESISTQNIAFIAGGLRHAANAQS
jgi:AcrR family transcriptional regulator